MEPKSHIFSAREVQRWMNYILSCDDCILRNLHVVLIWANRLNHILNYNKPSSIIKMVIHVYFLKSKSSMDVCNIRHIILTKVSWTNPVYFPVWSDINNFFFVFFPAKRVYAHKHIHVHWLVSDLIYKGKKLKQNRNIKRT